MGTRKLSIVSRGICGSLTVGIRGPAVVWLGLAAACAASLADDWPAYRHDNARSGVTAEQVKPPLSQCWVFQPRHAPQPAWEKPNPRPVGGWDRLVERPRVRFDDVFHVAVAGDALFFGSSADGKVRSLDAATGKVRWSKLTGGPVRLAPTVCEGKVYFGSDDGFVYCVRASDGTEVWKFRAAPKPRKVLGSGKMVSLWPLRAGVLVDDGAAYFAAGIFPAEGVYLYAVRADDGQELWCNDTFGAQPRSNVSPQGYLLASKTTLFVPMARVAPAAFDRKDGRMLYGGPFVRHRIGGTYALLAGDRLITGTEQMLAYDQKSPKARFAWFWGRQLIVTPETSYMATGREIAALNRTTYPKASLRRWSAVEQRYRVSHPLGVAKRKQRSLEAAIRTHEQALEKLDQQIGELAEKRRPASKEIAALKEQREAAKKKLETEAKALASAKEEVAKLQERIESAAEQREQAEADMAAGEKWRCPSECVDALILAGDVLFAGGDGKVAAFDSGTGEKLWAQEVNGRAKGLAAAAGRLLVSTDTGAIHCFGPAGSKQVGPIKETPNPSPYPRDELTPVFEAAAERIVRTTKIKRGYCLVLGCGTGRLAYELAKRTELIIYGVEPDARKVELARRALDAAGLCGTRVWVEQADPLRSPYSDYFANLIVSESALVAGELPGDAKEAYRMLKPLGGTICIGQPVEARGRTKSLSPDALRDWLAPAGIKRPRVTTRAGVWLKFARGPLPGAGSWTHQYAEPGNTTCSDDQLVRCPLGVLWFGEPGPHAMAGRHRRAAAPLAVNGRFFVQGEGYAPKIGVGENVVRAYDAYNGLKLWERRIRGALRVGVSSRPSSMAANAEDIFVTAGDKCFRLDAATGETNATYTLPPTNDAKPGRWHYVASVGKLLYGTQPPGRIFAVKTSNGRPRWVYQGESVPQTSISIGDGRVFFAESSVTDKQRQAWLKKQTARIKRLKGPERAEAEEKLKTATVRLVVALNARTGRRVWQKPIDLTGCGGGAYWMALGSIYKDGVLVFFGAYNDGHYWRDFFAGKFGARRVVAVSARDGKVLWSKKIGYRVRPIVVGDTFHAEPWAFDLRTGEQRMRVHPVTGRKEPWQFPRPGHHCGCPAASPHTLLFRSGCLGYYDLVRDEGTTHFAAQRPGCWINFIPANGLLIFPEASSGCMCPYPNQCTCVFKHREEPRAWAYFSSPGPMTPVKHLALNFGAPGDRRDKAGRLWFGYPRPGGHLVLRFRVDTTLLPGGGYFNHDPARVDVRGTEKPWLFQSGARGLTRCSVPLLAEGEEAGPYTVRLCFAEPTHDRAAQRVFSIKLQGKVVLTDFDVFKEAGARNAAVVREFKNVQVDRRLEIELVPKGDEPTTDQAPVINAIEVVREKPFHASFVPPSFLLSKAEPEQVREVRVTNASDTNFTGRLRAMAPDGIAIEPASTNLDLEPGATKVIELKATALRKLKLGDYEIDMRLVRQDGGVEWQRPATVTYIGERRRVVFKAVEDAHVTKGRPEANHGRAAGLGHDGGNQKMEDNSHTIAYLKFRLEVPGKTISAKLRLHVGQSNHSQSGDAGRVCLVEEPWSENTITYATRPQEGKEVGKLGAVKRGEVVERELKVELRGQKELSIALVPTSCDGTGFLSRESAHPPELIVEYGL